MRQKCDGIKNLLLEKNRKYGNSALEPARIFSKASSIEQILVRIDDKLNRIRNRQNDEDEDVYFDLAGYLVLLLVAIDARKEKKPLSLEEAAKKLSEIAAISGISVNPECKEKFTPGQWIIAKQGNMLRITTDNSCWVDVCRYITNAANAALIAAAPEMYAELAGICRTKELEYCRNNECAFCPIGNALKKARWEK